MVVQMFINYFLWDKYTDLTPIAYPKETVLPAFLEVGGRRCNVHSCAPKPINCHRCQSYRHSKLFKKN